MTAGVDAAVVRSFGEPLMQRVQQRILDQFLGAQPVGTAFVVPTGHPGVPFLAHAPTMRVPGSIEGTDKVYAATWAAGAAAEFAQRLGNRLVLVDALDRPGRLWPECLGDCP